MVHPDEKVVIPLAPEPILNSDGVKKNDCEHNATKRLLAHIRREHPHLKLTVVEDGLSSNAPHIRTLQSHGMHYILSAKPSNHKFLFDWVAQAKSSFHEVITTSGVRHQFSFVNGVPLNDKNFELEVNFLSYTEIRPDGKELKFSWVTDFKLTKENVYQVMRGGRARWRIENETFNTLKNQGYNFEHNYGHGNENLSTVLSLLMMIAFLMDQVQMLTSPLFRQARAMGGGNWQSLWENMRSLIRWIVFESWDQLFELIVMQHRPHAPPSFELIIQSV